MKPPYKKSMQSPGCGVATHLYSSAAADLNSYVLLVLRLVSFVFLALSLPTSSACPTFSGIEKEIFKQYEVAEQEVELLRVIWESETIVVAKTLSIEVSDESKIAKYDVIETLKGEVRETISRQAAAFKEDELLYVNVGSCYSSAFRIREYGEPIKDQKLIIYLDGENFLRTRPFSKDHTDISLDRELEMIRGVYKTKNKNEEPDGDT